jgi:hypothetical protein
MGDGVYSIGRAGRVLWPIEGFPPLASDRTGARRERKPVRSAVACRVEDAVERLDEELGRVLTLEES